MQSISNFTASETICRLCLDQDCVLQPLFGGETENILQIVTSLTQLAISNDDGLPQVICAQCVAFTRDITAFRQKCVESCQTLRRWFHAGRGKDAGNEELNVIDQLRVEFIECDESVAGDCEGVPETVKAVVQTEPPEEASDQRIEELAKEEDSRVFTDSGQCPLCGEHFPGGKRMVNHHLKCDHAPDDGLPKIRKCFFCPKAYSSFQLLKYHLNFHPQSQWECPECAKVFALKDKFIDHLRMHANDRYYGCEVCGKTFTMMKYLSVHRRQHKMQQRRIGSETPVSPGLQNDVTDVDAEMPVAQPSIPNSEACTEPKQEVNHNEIPASATKNRPAFVECEICGKRMRSNAYLANHRKTHRKEAPESGVQQAGGSPIDAPKKLYLCNICGRSCGSSSNLTLHLRRHSGQSICHCTHCGKGFPRRADMVMHMRKHTGEKPFVCSTCGRAFARQDKLVIHIRTHTGEKPYQCSCGRAYAQRNDLKSHQRRTVCGQNFQLLKLANSNRTIRIGTPPSTSPAAAPTGETPEMMLLKNSMPRAESGTNWTQCQTGTIINQNSVS
ncbi:zinc finger protein ZFP2-like [Anopheles cruzii]|uniref:zinc finger protein ZFP2-like n=1 Tax=Anopheles cruzii TaxID=68878 RepID=UPI0022EC98F4|nr:zinc finger protein ZFP2-like [Anopheles cruzii]